MTIILCILNKGGAFMDLLEGLNASQLQAVMLTEGMIRVIAGAGSGKTSALSHRFAYLVNELGILPGNILCVTFTNKSANEMRQRIHNLTGDNDTGYINTFHGFCVSILQEDSHAVSYPKSFLVLDNSDIDEMLKIIYEERNLTLRDMTFSQARDMIEILKLKEHPEYYLDMIHMSLDVLHRKYLEADNPKDIIFYGYLYQEKKCFALDYNDLIKFSLYIFSKNEDIKLKWQKRLEYIMIDEFQDIDELQYQLMKVLCAYHRNLFIVGDPDQTIYTWRGANVKYLLDFDKNFEDVKTIMMMENYRSTSEILNVSNSLIEKNKNRIKKDLIAMNKHGELVTYYNGESAEEESKWICEEIQRLNQMGISYRKICILYRAHYVTRSIEEALLKAKIPYTIYSGVQFFSRSEIKDALSYLRMIAYKDDLSFIRICNVPKRNIGQRRIQFLKEKANQDSLSLYEALIKYIEDPIFRGTKAKEFIDLIESFHTSYENQQISEVMSSLLHKSKYEEMLRTEGSQERLDNLAQLKQSIFEYETTCGEESTLPHYLSHIALFSNADMSDMEDKVKLMTVHSAKGLEFENVFLIEMNEGIFPSRKVRTLPGMEEERRLAFVAMTRAKNRLYLTSANGKNIDGSLRYPSRFVLDVKPDLLNVVLPLKEGLIEQAKQYIDVMNENIKDAKDFMKFNVKERIHHIAFGSGTVLEVDLDKKSYLIQFDKMETPRTISFKAKLKKEDEEVLLN